MHHSLFCCPRYELHAMTVHSYAAVMVLLSQIWTPRLDSSCGCCSHWPPPIHGLLKCRQFTDMLQSWVLFHLWNPAVLPDHAHVAVIGLLTALHSKCCLVTHTIRYNTIQYNTIQYNFIAKWQMHKECVMEPSTLIHTLTPVQEYKELI